MHYLAIILALLIPCTGFGQTLNPATSPYVSAVLKPAAGGASPTYLVKQGFEGTGYDNSETWTENATVNEDYATSPAPLDGLESWQTAAAGGEAYASFTGTAEVWTYMLISAPISGNDTVLNIRNSSGTAILGVRFLNTGAVRVQDNGLNTANSSTGIIYGTGTNYQVWTHYVKGTGANATCEVWVAKAGDSKPGSPTASLTTGNGATDAARIAIMGWSTGNFIMDKVRVDDVVIGDSPE